MPRLASLSAVTSFALGLVALASALPVRADVRTFGNWIVGCDNTGECTALGTPVGAPTPAEPAIVLRIGVNRSSLSGFEFAVILLPNGDPTTRTIVVACLLCGSGPDAAGDERADRIALNGQRLILPDLQGARWIDALGKGRRITVAWVGHAASVTIDTAAFMEAWIHLAQTRGDIMRQATIHQGLPSLHAGQPPPERRRAFPAAEVMPSGTPGIERLERQCPSGGETATYRPFALPGDATLWVVHCRRGGTVTTHWYQASGATGLPVALALPDGDRGQVDAGERGFEDSVFDFDFGILRARSGPAGREDCGVQRAWGWDGRAWFLLERRDMPACIGLQPSDWIRTYSAP